MPMKTETAFDRAKTCRFLRSKSMYIPGLSAAGEETAAMGASGHCWCNRTLSETGPDDRPVSPDLCRSGRSCCETP